MPVPVRWLSSRDAYHPIRWFLITGNRQSITLVLSGAVFVILLTAGTVWDFEMERLITETRAVQEMLNTLLGGIILFVSVVLSINIAALTQEFAPLRTQHTQIEESLELRTEFEAYRGRGESPTDVEGYFQFILYELHDELEALREQVVSNEGDAKAEIIEVIDNLERTATSLDDNIRSDQLSATLLACLDWESVYYLHAVRRIQVEHGDTLSEAVNSRLSDVVTILTAFTSGQKFFTTLYFKRELRNLSAGLLILALPVIVFTAYVLLAIDAGLYPDVTPPGISQRLFYVSFAFVVALSPYVMLSAYVLRIVTVSKHSLSSGGFTLSTTPALHRDK